MSKYDTDDTPLSPKEPSENPEEVIELEAVEIPRQRPTVHDIDEGGGQSYAREDYSEARDYRRPRPTFVFKTHQNAGCNCCLLWFFVFILAIFALF